MLVNINLKECEILSDISTYNSIYYKLPIQINECNILREQCDPLTEEFLGFSLCFYYYDLKLPTSIYWLHIDDTQELYGYIRIDSKLIDTINKWT